MSHASYNSYAKSLSEAELEREIGYAAKHLSEQSPMRQALLSEQATRKAISA